MIDGKKTKTSQDASLTCTLSRRVLKAFHLAQASFAVSRTRLLACNFQVAKREHVV